MTAISPPILDHVCQPQDIEYGNVIHRCGVCGRKWSLLLRRDIAGKVVWGEYRMDPLDAHMPGGRHDHGMYWEAQTPVRPKMSQEEITANRTLRLAQLDELARERAAEFSENDAAFQRWQLRGGGVKWRYDRTRARERRLTSLVAGTPVLTHKSIFRKT